MSLKRSETIVSSASGMASSSAKRLKLDSSAAIKKAPRRALARKRVKRIPFTQRKAIESIARRVLDQNTELKFNQQFLGVASAAIDWDGFRIEPSASIVQGMGNQNNRIGDSIKTTSVGVRILMSSNPISSTSFVHWRVVAVRWHNENGTPPSLGNLIPSIPTDIRHINGFVFDNYKNYTILDDTSFFTGPYATANSSPGWQTVALYDKVIPLGHKITFDDDNNIIDGGIYVFVLNNIDPSVTNKPVMQYVSRLYYKDD